MNLEFCLEWFSVQFTAARYVSSDVLVAISAIEALLLAFVFAAWRGTVRRVRTLDLANVGLNADVAAVGKALEKEIMWRLAGETPRANSVKSADNLKPRPPRELQELLARESFDPNLTMAEGAMNCGDLVGTTHGDQVVSDGARAARLIPGLSLERGPPEQPLP